MRPDPQYGLTMAAIENMFFGIKVDLNIPAKTWMEFVLPLIYYKGEKSEKEHWNKLRFKVVSCLVTYYHPPLGYWPAEKPSREH